MILVTGGTGFVGSALLQSLSKHGFETRTSVRTSVIGVPEGVQLAPIDDMTAVTDWSSALRGVDTVVHCAARVHVMKDGVADPLQAFRRINVDGTLRLAKQADRKSVV